MAEEQGNQSEIEIKEPARWVKGLRKGWEPEPIVHPWQHPLVSALAVIVCLVLAGLLQMKENYWAAISTLVVTQSEVGPTVSASVTQRAVSGDSAYWADVTALSNWFRKSAIWLKQA